MEKGMFFILSWKKKTKHQNRTPTIFLALTKDQTPKPYPNNFGIRSPYDTIMDPILSNYLFHLI